MNPGISYILKNTLLFLILIIATSCNKKKAINEFEVVIKTEAKTDSLSMYPSAINKKFLDTSYTYLYKGAINNRLVSFKGSIPSHPIMFDLIADRIGISDFFFIDSGTTELSVDFSNKENSVIIPSSSKSNAQKEYELLKKTGLDSIRTLYKQAKSIEERRQISIIQDTLIVDFIKNNPNSYVPLWLITNEFSTRGLRYNKLYDQSLRSFSEEIKQTYLFKKLSNTMNETKQFTFVNRELPFKDFDLKTINFKPDNLKDKKYILLDFWFSNCGPCLLEMPNYIPLYDMYKDKGFEIISISIDKTNNIQIWKKLIKARGFNWTHYLDENGIETRKLNVSSFPTTFLLSGDGEIIERNISAEALKSFLNSKLK